MEKIQSWLNSFVSSCCWKSGSCCNDQQRALSNFKLCNLLRVLCRLSHFAMLNFFKPFKFLHIVWPFDKFLRVHIIQLISIVGKVDTVSERNFNTSHSHYIFFQQQNDHKGHHRCYILLFSNTTSIPRAITDVTPLCFPNLGKRLTSTYIVHNCVKFSVSHCNKSHFSNSKTQKTSPSFVLSPCRGLLYM